MSYPGGGGELSGEENVRTPFRMDVTLYYTKVPYQNLDRQNLDWQNNPNPNPYP